ncbi:sensor domain-containing diguanylate cyclase [bacterium]|nr:sensor domain-containing diguanylate cyclase [bacterium]
MIKEKSGEDPNRLEKWFEFTQKLYCTLDLDQASHIALEIVLHLTGMQRGMLLTKENETAFQFRHAQNQEGRTLKQEQFPATNVLLREVCNQGSPVHKNHDSAGAKTVLCIPFLSNRAGSNTVIGILYCDSSEEIPYGESEKEMLNVFLMHAGPALESVIFYDWATRDMLTDVYQRHFFDAVSQIEWRRTLRHKHPATVLRVDLDRLRAYNESYGRKEGDTVLRKTAEILKEICRTEDIIARYDIDEFAVLLPETDTAGARLVSGRITEEVPLLLTRDPDRPVTVSIGGATYPRCSVNNIVDLMRLAGIALSHAKQAGGARAIHYEPSLSSAHKKIF